ncbi:MAG TPA: hypothetical protein VE545_01500 [Candidatus Dormibacteraeota bacterium]|nr:hypothetical protein [Candidatus Dormibacteraeota bacterium]
MAALVWAAFFAGTASAQAEKGAIDLTARITPTAARPEPVRQFTFYVLTRSYTDVAHDVGAQNVLPSRDTFIDTLKVSPELKVWLKAHDILDLTMPELDKAIVAEDIIKVPEFLLAYQKSNSGGVTNGIPKPRYKEADKADRPEKYEKDRQDYLMSLKKYIQAHPETVNGMELELTAVNPQDKWARLGSEQRRVVQRMAPDVAQSKYLVAKADTDLDGHATINGLPAGQYWLTSLNLDADAGDARLRWDVPVTIIPGRTTRIELTNLNATDAHATPAP